MIYKLRCTLYNVHHTVRCTSYIILCTFYIILYVKCRLYIVILQCWVNNEHSDLTAHTYSLLKIGSQKCRNITHSLHAKHEQLLNVNTNIHCVIFTLCVTLIQQLTSPDFLTKLPCKISCNNHTTTYQTGLNAEPVIAADPGCKMISLERLNEWILYGYLVCPSQLNSSDQKAWKNALSDSYIITLFRDEVVNIHAMYIEVMFNFHHQSGLHRYSVVRRKE